MDFQLSLESEPVGAAYPTEPLGIAPTATIAEAMQLLRAQKTGAVLVCEGSALAGIFTERDALKIMADGVDTKRPIRDVMSAEPVTLSAEDTVGTAIQKMSKGGYRHLPIVDELGQPAGVVSVRGIVHYLVDHFPGTIYNLPPGPDVVPKAREGA